MPFVSSGVTDGYEPLSSESLLLLSGSWTTIDATMPASAWPTINREISIQYVYMYIASIHVSNDMDDVDGWKDSDRQAPSIETMVQGKG